MLLPHMKIKLTTYSGAFVRLVYCVIGQPGLACLWRVPIELYGNRYKSTIGDVSRVPWTRGQWGGGEDSGQASSLSGFHLRATGSARFVHWGAQYAFRSPACSGAAGCRDLVTAHGPPRRVLDGSDPCFCQIDMERQARQAPVLSIRWRVPGQFHLGNS